MPPRKTTAERPGARGARLDGKRLLARVRALPFFLLLFVLIEMGSTSIEGDAGMEALQLARLVF